jgi:hypothetical protein
MNKSIYINSYIWINIDGNWSVLITLINTSRRQVATVSVQMLMEGGQQFIYDQASLSTNMTQNRKCSTTYGGSILRRI